MHVLLENKSRDRLDGKGWCMYYRTVGAGICQMRERAGLEIRVVLWPQSSKTSVGPPDISMWWSGGLLKTLKKQYFGNIFKMCTNTFLTNVISFSIKCMNCKVFSSLVRSR